MSRHNNKNGVYVDIGLLRDHISKLSEEKKLAINLHESIRAMRDLSDPMEHSQYDSLLYDTEQLITYFVRMIQVFREAEYNAISLSRYIGQRIDCDTMRVRNETLNVINL